MNPTTKSRVALVAAFAFVAGAVSVSALRTARADVAPTATDVAPGVQLHRVSQGSEVCYVATSRGGAVALSCVR